MTKWTEVKQDSHILTKDNFEELAPMGVHALLEAVVAMNANVLIGGQCGTGKTTLLNLMTGFTKETDRIQVITDSDDERMAPLYPDKQIVEHVPDKGSLKSNECFNVLQSRPDWVILSETRGEEAYALLNIVLTGHHIMTTMHTARAIYIPTRLVTMIRMYVPETDVSDEALEHDIHSYFDLGIQMERELINGKLMYYIGEILHFDKDGDTTLFSQKVDGEVMTATYGYLPKEFRERAEKMDVSFKDFTEGVTHSRQLI